MKKHLVKPNPAVPENPDAGRENHDDTCNKTTETLKESEERFRQIFNASPIGMALMTPDLRFFSVNPAWIAMTGYSEEELLALTVRDITHPDYLAGDLEHLQNLIAGTISVYSTEKQYIRKDKSTLWGLLRVTAIRDGNGQFRYLAAQIEDITARKEADDALRESEVRFREQYQNNPLAIFTWQHQDDDFVLVDYNRAADILTKGESKKYLGKSASELYSLRMELLSEIRQCFFDHQSISKDLVSEHFLPGRFIHATAAYVPPDLIMVHMEDMTDRKRAEDARAQSESRLRSFVETTGDSVVIVDEEGKVIEWNPASERITGLCKDQTFGRYIWDVTLAMALPGKRTEANRHAIEHSMREMLSTGTSLYSEPRIVDAVRPDGTRFTTRQVIFPIKTPNGFRVGSIAQDVTAERAAAAALEESNRRLTTLIGNLQDMVYRCRNDPDWTMEYVSEGCIGLTGYTPDEFVTKRSVAYGNLIHPDDRENVWNDVQKALSERLPYRLKYRLIARDGTVHWVWELGRGVYSPEGTLLALEGYNADITAQQNAEDALKKTYDLLNETQEFSHLGGWEYDVATGRVTWTDEVYRIHGVDRGLDPAVVSRDLRFYTQESKEVLDKTFQDCVENNKPYDISADLIRADAKKIRVRIMGKPDAAGGKVVRVHGTIMDITERWQAEEAVRHKSALLEAQLQSSLDGTLIVDPKGKKILQNRRTIELWKIPQDIAENDNDETQVKHVMHMTKDPDRFVEKVAYLYDHPRETSYDTVELIDGTILERYSAPIFGDDGYYYGRIWKFHDITERRKAETVQENLIAELAQKNAELDRFTYTVSHDLKSPLIGIRAFLTLLEDDIKSGNTVNAARDITMMSESASKLEHMISTLLTLSRSGRIVSTPLPVSLHEVVQSALDLLGPRLHEHGICVVESDHFPVVMGDRERLLQVMTNLIDNAIKFRGDQQHLSVEVGMQQDACGPVFFVRDNGMGIRKEDLSKIFMLYERLNPAIPGTGIGLATVRRIVEAHGGKIRVESEGPGKGTTFYFTLPGVTRNPG